MADLSEIMSERRQLINLAYRMLGSLADAEDVVQETYARWYALSHAQQQAIASPGAWLTTVASRICLDQLRSARARRERYVGEWIPEPLPEDTSVADPADRVTLDESVSMAFLVVLDSMTPAERVAFVLHDVFRYPFDEVGEIVGRTPAACRQLASQARKRVDASRTRSTPDPRRAGIVREFKAAWQAQDIAALVDLLDPDAIATGDGGGLVNAARHPVVGGAEVARYFASLVVQGTGVTLNETTVNGEPGLAATLDGATIMVMAFDLAGDRISRIWAVLNPEKLRPWSQAAGESN